MNEGRPFDASGTDRGTRDPLQRFSRDCDDGFEPDLATFVCSLRDPVDERVLVDLIKLDLARRWQSGRGRLIEEYFRVWSRLAESSALSRELLIAEYLARSTYHTTPSRGELADRFPKIVDALDLDELSRQARAASLRESYEGTGRFFVVRKVGAGGMGEVYAALDRERQGIVALKTLPTVSPERLYRFKREFRVLAETVHPNLVPLYELISCGDKWFFTMELIGGVDLLFYLRRASIRADATTCAFSGDPDDTGTEAVGPDRTLPAGPVDVARLNNVFRQLVEALMVLHRAGTLHRDIKPSNVLVRADGRVVVLDFGVIAEIGEESPGQETGPSLEGPARVFANSPWGTDWSIVGTPGYMSPEQAVGKPLTPATDWYSVGVVLYLVLTGRRPFGGPTEQVLFKKQVSDPPRPETLQNQVPPHLSELCERLLERDPARRPGGAEILARLEEGVSSVDELRGADTARDAPFVGRERDLRELQRAYGEMLKCSTIVVDVSGPSGVGKTRLVRQFLAGVACEPKTVVLQGRCYERESVPYKALDLLVDSLSRYLASLPRHESDVLMPRDVAALIRLFPVLSRVKAVAQARGRPLESSDAQDMRQQATQALREVLTRIGDRSPLVLWIDDLQWDDADSAAVLSAIIQQAEDLRLLLLLSFRSEQTDRMQCLRAIDGALAGRKGQTHGCVRHSISVGPLSDAESEELAGHLLQDNLEARHDVVHMVARQSQGTPYFVQELARYVSGEASAALSSDALRTVELDQVLKTRIGRLPDSERRLLETISVAGRPVKLATAYKAASLEPADRQAVVDLCSAHLLRTAGPKLGDEADVFHDRLRVSVLSLLSQELLCQHHARLAAALEEDHEDAEMIATHFHRAGQVDKAITYYALAADRAADALAFNRAARLYQASIDLNSQVVRPLPDLERKLADALANAGRGREAADVYLGLAAGAGPAEALELRRRAAYHYCASGHIARGRDEFAAILLKIGMRLPQSPRTAIVSCVWRRLVLRCRGLGFRERREGDLDAGELAAIDITWSVSIGLTMIDTIHAADYQARNLLLALRAGEPYRIARALAWQACHIATGGFRARRQSERLLDAAASIMPRINNPHATGLLVIARGITAFFQGEWTKGLARCDEGESILREHCTGVVWERATARSFALWSLYFLGRTAELMVRQPELLREARQRGDLLAEASLTNLTGTLMSLARNRPLEALDDLATAMRPWECLGFRTQHFTALASYAQIDLYGGDYRAAFDRLESQWRNLKRSMLMHIEAIRIFMLHLRASCAVAAAEAGADGGQYVRIARRCANRLSAEKAPWGVALGQLIRAALADLRGDRNRALSLISIAVSHLEEAQMGLYTAAARHRQGELLGGDAGRALVAEAKAWMDQQKIRDCNAMVRLYAGGFRL